MPITGKEKILTLKLHPETHRKMKVIASIKNISIKKYLTELIDNIYQEVLSNELEYDKEPLTEEEEKLFEDAKRDVEEGRFISWKDYKDGNNIN